MHQSASNRTTTNVSRTRIPKIGVLLLSLAAMTYVLLAGGRESTVHAFAEGPPAGETGAPGEGTCVQCHFGSALNSGPGQFTISAPSTYVPGNTYQITVQHTTSDQSRRRWGFEVTVLDSSNNKAGDLQSTSGFTQVLNNTGPTGNRQYIEHTSSGTFNGTTGGATWTFNWVAPATAAGTITFYAAGNEANGDGTPSGDQIYTTTATAAVNSPPSGPPVITSATAGRKHLFVEGHDFDIGAVITINGVDQPTANDDTSPTTSLIGIKVIKRGHIVPGQTVMLQVRDANKMLSNEFAFTR